jgi:hypothetical protein
MKAKTITTENSEPALPPASLYAELSRAAAILGLVGRLDTGDENYADMFVSVEVVTDMLRKIIDEVN